MIENLLRRLIAREPVPLADALEAQLELTHIRQQLGAYQQDTELLEFLAQPEHRKVEIITLAPDTQPNWRWQLIINGGCSHHATTLREAIAAIRKETRV